MSPATTGVDNSPEALRRDVLEKLFCDLGKFPAIATPTDYYLALAHVVRDRLMHRWISTARTYFQRASRTVVYLSAEFLMGPQLDNNLINLEIRDPARQAVASLGYRLDELLAHEPEPGLGNGGLGRLAACYMDSLATLQIPAIGYGIRYEFGIFEQGIRDGWQIERTDKWLRLGNPWEIAKPETAYQVPFGGRTETVADPTGRVRVRWIPDRVVVGTAYDTPVLGYAVNTANTLRLWSAQASESFDFQAFNVGDYYRAVEAKVVSENISKVLYPNDGPEVGKALRLEQQYFLVSCALQDMIRIYLQRADSLARFHEKYAVQLNDTHPALAVAELMRLLVDEHGLEWETAWDVTTRTFGYTNHTLLPEALETWPLTLFGRLLPRPLEIVREINRRFLDDVRGRFPGDGERAERLSLVDEGAARVRMAHLACVGSHAINGVAALHTALLQDTVLRDFHALWPEKFSNKTNGVTPRRFLLLANPELSRLVTSAIGTGWVKDLEELRRLEPLADDTGFRDEWARVQAARKRALAELVAAATGTTVDPGSLFDVQVKRIHEYKRQHLNLLHVLTLHARLKRGVAGPPRTVVFGGKAAPGYVAAKRIIRLVNAVAQTLNGDAQTNGALRVVFIPNFNVGSAQVIYPAADLSEQISTAGFEASGTGNMKLALNGALTIGTLDGANIEIRDAVGADNFFRFGLTADEVARRRAEGYRPREYYEGDAELREVLDLVASGALAPGDRDVFRPLVDELLAQDRFMLLADYAAYVACQEEVARAWHDRDRWTRMSILNVARTGRFSSDRAVEEYCREIWRVGPVAIDLA